MCAHSLHAPCRQTRGLEAGWGSRAQPWSHPTPAPRCSPPAAAAVPPGGAHPDLLGGERPRAVSERASGAFPGEGRAGRAGRVCVQPRPLSPRSAGGPRKGYMGHLTRVANALAQNSEKGPNAEQLGQLLKGEGWGRPGGGRRLGARGLVSSQPPFPQQSCQSSSGSGGRCSCRDPWRRPTRRTRWTW